MPEGNQMEFAKRYNDLTCLFLSRFMERTPEDNIVFSPFSILSLLAILEEATGGTTRQEASKLLYGELPQHGFPEWLKAAREELMKKELDFLYSDGLVKDYSSHLHTANLVCVQEGIRDTLRSDFQKKLKDMYDGTLFSSSNVIEAMKALDSAGMLSDFWPLVEGLAKGEALLAMANTVSFDAMWQRPFEGHDIRKGSFQNADHSVSQVNMLYGGGGAYVENDLAVGFIKDFQQCNYSFMALLPREKGPEALMDVIRSVKLHELSTHGKHVILYSKFPEFSFSFKVLLNQIVQALGVREAFTNQADFSAMSSAPLKADSMIHQAKIRVDRNGASASAATTLILVGSALPEEVKRVTIDRPFLFAIMHKGLNIPVFAGVVNRLMEEHRKG